MKKDGRTRQKDDIIREKRERGRKINRMEETEGEGERLIRQEREREREEEEEERLVGF